MGGIAKIMIVEDNVAGLKLVGDLLEIDGFDVSRCVDAQSALTALLQFHPDLILLDLAMPGMDGMQLAHKLKSEKKTEDLVIVALTASAMKGDREKILSSGFDGYLTKPIDTRVFAKQIIEFIPFLRK